MIGTSRLFARALLVAMIPFLTISCGGSDSTGPGDGNGNGNPTVSRVEVAPSTVNLTVEGTQQLTATPQTGAGQPVSAAISWSSLGESVATVSLSGLVSAVGPGSTTITASVGAIVGSASVTVTEDESPPDAPSDLAAVQVGPDLVDLSWTDNSSNETGFEVQRSLGEASGFASLGTTAADVTGYADDTVDPQTTYYYRVRATGGGESSDFGNVDEATTTAPLNPASPIECEREGYPCSWSEVDPTVFDGSDLLANEILMMFKDGGTTGDASSWLESQPQTVDIVFSEDAVRFRLAGGRPTWVYHPDSFRRPDGAPLPTADIEIRPANDVVGDDPKTKRALVLAFYQYEFGAEDDSPAVAALLEGARGYGGNVDYFANTDTDRQASVDHFGGWGDYDVIHVSSHGEQICEEGEECQTSILSGSTSRGFILEDTNTGVDFVRIEIDEYENSVSTDYFRSQYPGGLPDAIVFISACESAKGDDLAQALTGNGGAFLGWTESVSWEGSYRASLAFYGELISEGKPATLAFQTLQEGDDLTTDFPDEDTGAIAKLEVFAGGNDLRIREVVFPLNPLTKQELEEEQIFPYPIVGQPGDGVPDRIPYVIRVDGVDGDPNGFIVNVRINGFPADPKPLSEGEPVDGDGNVWEVKDQLLVPFDAMQGQPIEVDVTVDLPEGGESRWYEDTTLGNPLLRFNSTIISEGGAAPVVSQESKVEAEFPLGIGPDFDNLAGIDDLIYTEFNVEVASDCTVETMTDNGDLRIREAKFPSDVQSGVPQDVVLVVLPTIHESMTISCEGGSFQFPSLIHFLAGFYSWHGGELCGDNELDEDRGGFVIPGWTAGSGEVIARKEYDRSCPVEGGIVKEMTTLELVKPMAAMGSAVARGGGAGPSP